MMPQIFTCDKCGLKTVLIGFRHECSKATPKDACICGEINARHCPVHQDASGVSDIMCFRCGYPRISLEYCTNQLCHGPQAQMIEKSAYDKLAAENKRILDAANERERRYMDIDHDNRRLTQALDLAVIALGKITVSEACAEYVAKQALEEIRKIRGAE